MGDIAGIERAPIGSFENPFGMAPSSSRFYGNGAYEEACNTILNGIRERRGLILVTGEPGTGKTTIVQQAIDRLDKGRCSVLFCSFHPALDETLNSLCQHVGLSVAEQQQQQKAQQLNEKLLARSRQGKRTAFVVDDAHTLDARTLAQLLSLADRTVTGEHLLQVVLVGLPELDAKLHSAVCRPALPSAFPSVKVHALPPAEVAPFIEHQLKAAAANPRLVVSAEAMQRIAAYSKGIPREINALCGLASVIANLESSLVVTAEMIEEIKGERALWGVGIDAETTAPSPENTAQTQVRRASVTPWTSVHPTVYPPQQQLKAVNDSDGGDTRGEQNFDSSPPWVGKQNGASLDAATASPMAPTLAPEKPEEEHSLASRERWVPSWGLTGSALALSLLFLAGAVFWEQLPLSGDSARSNATGRADTRSAQDNLEAEMEFAQMRPVITADTAKPVPSTAPDVLPRSVPAIPPPSSAEASPPAVDRPGESQSASIRPREPQVAQPRSELPTLASPDAAPSTGKAADTVLQPGNQPMAALSKSDPATAAEPAAEEQTNRPAANAVAEPTEPPKAQAVAPPASAEIPAATIPAPIASLDPGAASGRAGTAGKPGTRQPRQTDNASQAVVHANPAQSLPSSTPEEATSAAIREQPSRASPEETALPSILGSVDSSAYQSMGNEVMDQVTAQMLPADPKQIDLPGFRQFLSESAQPSAAAALSGPAALGSSALPLNPGSLSTFSGR